VNPSPDQRETEKESKESRKANRAYVHKFLQTYGHIFNSAFRTTKRSQSDVGHPGGEAPDTHTGKRAISLLQYSYTRKAVLLS
jgi:hypothetical protein